MSPKKKKTYLAVVGVLGCAFLVDRFVLSESATAPQVATAAPMSAGNGGTQVESPTKTQIPGVPFPKNIPTFGDGFTLRDVFVKPDSGDGMTPNTKEEQTQPENLTSEEFTTGHTLTAVFSDGGVVIAVVDGAWLRVGQSLTGCELIAVSGEEARFQCRDGESKLVISDALGVH